MLVAVDQLTLLNIPEPDPELNSTPGTVMHADIARMPNTDSPTISSALARHGTNTWSH